VAAGVVARRPPALQRQMIHVALGVPLVFLTVGSVMLVSGAAGVSTGLEGVDVRASVALVLTLGALAMLTAPRSRLEWFWALLWMMLIQATLIGWLNLSMADPDYALRFFVPHLAAGGLILCGYQAMAGMKDEPEEWLGATLDRYSLLTVGVMLLYLSAFTIDWLRGGTYWGPSTGPLLIPAAWFAVRGKWRWAVLSGALILLNGKRGPAVAVLVTWLVLWLSMWRGVSWRQKRSVLRWSIAVGVLMTVGVSLAVRNYNPETAPLALVATISKWQLLDPAQDNFDLNQASAGRFSEVALAYETFSSRPLNWIVGTGYGWSFLDFNRLPLHYLHLSPLNVLIQYGVPLFFLFFAGVTGRVWRALRRRSDGPEDVVYLGVALTVIAGLVDGLFSYMYAVNPWIWIGLGLLGGQQRRMARQLSARRLSEAG
jgi:hypothetical protein